MKNLTEIRKLSLEQLKEYAQTLGIEYNNEKKAYLLELVIAKFLSTSNKMSNDKDLTEENLNVINDKSLSKSEKMRRLCDQGLSTAQISRELDAHYSFVHTIVNKHLAKQGAEQVIEKLKEEIQVAVANNIQDQQEEPIIRVKKSKKQAIEI